MKRFLQSHSLEVFGGLCLAILLAAFGVLWPREASAQTGVTQTQTATKPVTPLAPTDSPIIPSLTPAPSRTPTPLLPVTLPTSIPSQTPVIPSTATPTLSPTPTPLMGVAWSLEAPAIYLREEPGGEVLIELQNGTPLHLLDERQVLGGIEWRRVVVMFSNFNPGGWIAEDLIIPEMYLPNENRLVVSADSLYLRAAPNERIVATLWKGMSLRLIETREIAVTEHPADTEHPNGQTWAHVFVPDTDGPDGLEGWVLQALVATPTPVVTPVRGPVPTLESCSAADEETLAVALQAAIPPSLEKRYGQTLLATFVSSGELETVEVTLPDGLKVFVDRVIAYTSGKDGSVVAVPVTIGAHFPDGYVAFNNPATTQAWANRANAQAILPRGRLFMAMLTEFVAWDQVDWEQCQATGWYVEQFGAASCGLGASVDQQFPDGLQAFLAGSQPPPGWFLVGWLIDTVSVPTQFLEGMPSCQP